MSIFRQAPFDKLRVNGFSGTFDIGPTNRSG